MSDDAQILYIWLFIFLFVITLVLLIRKNSRVRAFFQKPFFPIRSDDSLPLKIFKWFVLVCVIGHIVCSLLKLFHIL